MSETEKVLTIDPDKLVVIGRLLVGAAYADGDYHELEEEQITRILGEFVHEQEPAARIAEDLNSFDPASFSVEEACEELGSLDDGDKQLVLNMVGHVVDADFVHDFDESDYVRRVADALGASADDYQDLTVEVVEE